MPYNYLLNVCCWYLRGIFIDDTYLFILDIRLNSLAIFSHVLSFYEVINRQFSCNSDVSAADLTSDDLVNDNSWIQTEPSSCTGNLLAHNSIYITKYQNTITLFIFIIMCDCSLISNLKSKLCLLN